MKKIIIATDAWYPQVNGVVKYTDEIKQQLEGKNFCVILLHPGIFKFIPLIFYPEIRIAIFPKRKIREIIKKENPDYIHIMTEGSIGFATRSICLKDRLNFTTSLHTNFQIYFKHYFKFNGESIIYFALRRFHNAGNGTMVITDGLKKNMESNGLKRVLLSPLGTDTDFFKRNNKKRPEDYGLKSPVFAYFGRVAKEKNIEEFLDLDLPGSKIVIGDGPAKKSLMKKYGSKSVFVGYKFGQELVDYLSVCDVFVFPSRTDAFPLVIIESLSCGVPVAAHNVMDLYKLAEEKVGVLDSDLKKASLECLKIDRAKCREYALNFSWQKSGECFIANLVKTKK